MQIDYAHTHIMSYTLTTEGIAVDNILLHRTTKVYISSQRYSRTCFRTTYLDILIKCIYKVLEIRIGNFLSDFTYSSNFIITSNPIK